MLCCAVLLLGHWTGHCAAVHSHLLTLESTFRPALSSLPPPLPSCLQISPDERVQIPVLTDLDVNRCAAGTGA